MLQNRLQAAIGLLYLGYVLVGLSATGEEATHANILPQDRKSPVGGPAVIRCRLASQNIAWTFCPQGGGQPFVVASDNCAAVKSTSDKFDVDKSNSSCHLLIKNVATNLFGTYTCQDLNSNEQGHSAVLSLKATNENVALNKNATQSSTYTGSTGMVGLASKAVDGDLNADWFSNKCTHTNSDNPSWWAVDLGEETPVGRVRITNRNTVPERLSNFYIGLTNVSPWTSAPSLTTSSICKFTVVYPPASVPTNITCDAGTTPGRYLYVMLTDTINPLTLCELEAYYF
jgi:hypothetical protein